jgi:hypothetical protein
MGPPKLAVQIEPAKFGSAKLVNPFEVSTTDNVR